MSSNVGNIDMTNMSSVKEMIFSRAREKSEALAKEQNEQMTSSVQNDVMTQARASISSGRMMAFGGLTKSTSLQGKFVQSVQPQEITEVKQIQETPQLKHNVQEVENSTYTAATQDEVMRSARNQFARKTSINDCLKFLNTQAAISLVNSTRHPRDVQNQDSLTG